AHLQCRRVYRLDRTQLPGLDLAPHRVPPGAELNGFPVLEAGDILGSPSHAVSFRRSAQQGEQPGINELAVLEEVLPQEPLLLEAALLQDTGRRRVVAEDVGG